MMKLNVKYLIALIFVSALLHEIGHVIVGGGITGFRYAPEYDFIAFEIFTPHHSIYSDFAGFAFASPLLLLKIYPKILLIILIFQARWDFLSIILEVFYPSVCFC